MSVQVRLLRRVAVAAAVLALAAWAVPRFGIVFVGGWSMSPALIPGDLVVYRRAAEATEGDVVLVARPGEAPFLHRVATVRLDGRLRTQGDANDAADAEPASPADVAGITVAVVPSGRAIHAALAGARWCYGRVPIANLRR
ncbi:MAG: S24/S26 family peptidase [Coriobacteriia bacterium]|nr:S24/S26 family peptidase [Coriobacteriia bacterium]